MYHNESPSQQDLINQLDEACALHQSGAYAQAERRYRLLLSRLPDCWQLLYNLGLLLYDLGRYDEAAEIYGRALCLGIEDGDLYFNLALTCKQQGDFAQAIRYYQKALNLQPDDIDYLYNLAGCYLAGGFYEEASETYEALLRRDPGHLFALNNFAYLNHIAGKTENARALYQLLLTLRPDSSSAEHMLAALSGEQRTSAPPDYIRDMFDQYADHYETSLLGTLHYTVPKLLEALVTSVTQKDIFTGMLDLGCGTGLIGECFRNRVERLHGVDLSKKMIALADKKKCYDALYVEEIEHFLRQCTTRYDLVVAADVFPYVGHVHHIFQYSRDVTTDDGLFFFTIEELSGTDCSLHLGASGRFAHTDHFIRRCAAECGWTVGAAKRIALRMERDDWVAGIIYGLSPHAR